MKHALPDIVGFLTTNLCQAGCLHPPPYTPLQNQQADFPSPAQGETSVGISNIQQGIMNIEVGMYSIYQPLSKHLIIGYWIFLCSIFRESSLEGGAGLSEYEAWRRV